MSLIYEYHRSKLNRRLDSVYNSILEAVKNRQKTLEISGVGYPDISKCYNSVFYDHPEVFWMSHQCNAQISKSLFESRVSLVLDYIYTEKDSLAINQKAAVLARQVKGNNDEETENNIVELIVKDTVYEIDANYNQNMASALYFGKAQCSGIAKAVKYLCDCNNIRCIFVNGAIKIMGGGPHAWNLIEIKGYYYHLDVTSILGSNPAGSKVLFKPFFNLADSQISSSHAWDNKDFPACSRIYDEPSKQNYSQSNHNANQSGPVHFSPTPLKTVNNSQNTDGIIKLSTLAQLRSYIEGQYNAHQKEVVFVLELSLSAEERMRLIKNAVKMVMSKLNASGHFVVEVIGDINKIKFN